MSTNMPTGVTPAAEEYLRLCKEAAASAPQDPIIVAAARGETERVRGLLTKWHRSQGHPLPE